MYCFVHKGGPESLSPPAFVRNGERSSLYLPGRTWEPIFFLTLSTWRTGSFSSPVVVHQGGRCSLSASSIVHQRGHGGGGISLVLLLSIRENSGAYSYMYVRTREDREPLLAWRCPSWSSIGTHSSFCPPLSRVILYLQD